MNKDKVYLEGYVVGHAADTLGYKGLLVQLGNLEIVEIDKDLVHKDINEPKEVVVEQFVADWIEKERKSGGDLEDLFNDIVYEQDHIEWFREEENMNLVARAWLDGYEVEEEKRYLVKMKGVEDIMGFLNFGGITKTWFMGDEINSYGCRTHHTRKELEEAGFGEVFNNSLFEIQGVNRK